MPELPNPVYWAIPAFIGLLLVEYAVARRQQRRLFEGKDTATSLGLGLGSLVAGIASAGLGVAIAF